MLNVKQDVFIEHDNSQKSWVVRVYNIELFFIHNGKIYKVKTNKIKNTNLKRKYKMSCEFILESV